MTEIAKKQTEIQMNARAKKSQKVQSEKLSGKIKPWLFLLPTDCIDCVLDDQAADPDINVYAV